MVDVARLQVEVDSRQVNTAEERLGKFSRSSNKAEREAKQFTSATNKTEKSMRRLNTGLRTATRLLGAVGLTIGAQQLISYSNNVLQSTLNIERQSQALGISAERFQELSFTFQQFGADSADISDVLNTLADRATDAVDGMQSFIDDFALVGIEVDQLRNKRPVELFELFTQAISSIEDPTRRNAAAVRILGDDIGNRLLPLLQEGTEGLDAYAQQANTVGAVLSNDLVQGGAEAARTFQEVRAQISSESAAVIAQNAEGLVALAEAASAVATAFIELGAIAGTVLSNLNDGVTAIEKPFIDTLNKVYDVLFGLKDVQEDLEISQPERQSRLPSLPMAEGIVDGPEELTNVNLVLEEIVKNIDRAPEKTNAFADALESVGDSLREVEGTIEGGIGNALEDMILRGEEASDVFKRLAADIATAVLRQQVIDPFAQQATSALLGLFPGGAGSTSIGGGAPPNVRGIGPERANGGNVYGNTAHLVGERGPELFVPRQDGSIVPNNRMGGGGDVTVNIINEGGEQLETTQQQQRRGPNGEMTVDVMVKSSMERLDAQGQLDGIFRRHGARRQGQF